MDKLLLALTFVMSLPLGAALHMPKDAQKKPMLSQETYLKIAAPVSNNGFVNSSNLHHAQTVARVIFVIESMASLSFDELNGLVNYYGHLERSFLLQRWGAAQAILLGLKTIYTADYGSITEWCNAYTWWRCYSGCPAFRARMGMELVEMLEPELFPNVKNPKK